MKNDITTTQETETREQAERTEEQTFEVREEQGEKFRVSEFERAPLTDVNFGF